MNLCSELLRLVKAPSEGLGLNGTPAPIRWRADVVVVNTGRGDLRLGNGVAMVESY